jgi:Putative Ig domain
MQLNKCSARFFHHPHQITGYLPPSFERNENILMHFRVSTVQCPKVIYVIQLLLFRVCNRTRNAEVPQKIRFEDGVMFPLVSFQSRIFRASSSNRPSTEFSIVLGFLLITFIALTSACSSLNAGTPSSATSRPAQPIAMSAHLPPATVGSEYRAVIAVSGGTAPYSFLIRTGKLPPGLNINRVTGSIYGLPMHAGTYAFVIAVLDSKHTAEGLQKFALTVSELSAAQNAVQVAIAPASLTLAAGGGHQFAAKVSNTSNHDVTWWASAGKITTTGYFTAPTVNASTRVQLVASSKADTSKRAYAYVDVTAAPASSTPLAMTSTPLPQATEGVPYTAGLRATGGNAPYRWKIAAGSLPSGFSFDATAGSINGTASQSGSFPLTIQAADTAGQTASQQFAIHVLPAANGNFDGPAELPRVYVKSSLADTPAPGASHNVATIASLQSTLNSANCGDTILLQAGATFQGTVVLPAKNCDDNHWIIVRTSADDSALPAEGSRLTPCYAGISSLPGRPALNCASTQNVLPKLFMPTKGNGPIIFASGANHYRLMGLEITRAAGTGLVYALASIVNGGTANNLILDRVWMHGTAQDETNRGFWLQGSTYVSVVDSSLTDFHCVSKTGDCTDSQTIAGGLGSGLMGPYKISGNFLEASGENILFGGGPATATPADIEISRNHFFKPLTWLRGQPGFVGGRDGNPFLVKNLLELKNAKRVLVESNIMEGSWGGFSQAGFGILITPKNQATSDGSNVCPICQVTDVTIRNTTISHVGAGLQIANAMAGTGAPLDGQRYSIHDIVVDDIDGAKFDGPSELAQVSTSAGAPTLQNVTINHVTAFPSSHLFIVGAFTTPMKNFVFTNNIVNAGTYPVWSTGGGLTNCAASDSPLTTLNACFNPYTFTGNAIISSTTSAVWPSPNLLQASLSPVQFVNYNGGNSGDYHLLSTSPYKGKASDGKDPGADIDAVAAAIAGVR